MEVAKIKKYMVFFVHENATSPLKTANARGVSGRKPNVRNEKNITPADFAKVETDSSSSLSSEVSMLIMLFSSASGYFI